MNYHRLPDYQKRVVDEYNGLVDKITLLNTFINTNPLFKTLSDAEQDRMHRQLKAMQAYSDVLSERIEAFGETA